MWLLLYVIKFMSKPGTFVKVQTASTVKLMLLHANNAIADKAALLRRLDCAFVIRYLESISFSTGENLILLHANNTGAGQPAHSHHLICAFVIRYLDFLYSNLLHVDTNFQ